MLDLLLFIHAASIKNGQGGESISHIRKVISKIKQAGLL